jgi:ABC-2 type transport system ATP-binding protein
MPVFGRSQPESVPGSPSGIGHRRRPPLQAVDPAPGRSASDPSRGGLRASDLCRSFGAEGAVDHVDLQVLRGQIHALVGLNGAGKTTLMRLLLGMLRPDRGSVTIFGRPVADARNDLWRRVGHMLDTAFGYPELTVTENLRCAALLRGLPEATVRAAVNSGISDLRLSSWADRPTRTLSTGNRQRLGLACALLGDPDLLVLDEPTTALDPAGVVLVRTLLRAAAAARGTAVLVSSHHLDEMARIANHISVMHRGRIVGTLDPAGVDLERTFFDLVLAVDEADDGRSQ